MAYEVFAGFDTCNDDALVRELAAATKFANCLINQGSPHSISLLGSIGVGKTMLAKALLKFWREHAGVKIIGGKAGSFASRQEGRFVLFPKFVERQLSGQYGEMDGIAETPFVVVDDIGRVISGPPAFAAAKLDALVEARLGKWTVYTSNLDMMQLAQIDPRIVSRLIRNNGIVICTMTADYNTRKQ